MYVDSDCLSPLFALINQDTVGTTDLCRATARPVQRHNNAVPNSVPRETALAQKHLQKLDKKHIFQIAVEEKKEGAETILRSVLCRDDLVLSQTGYTVLHIPKS